MGTPYHGFEQDRSAVRSTMPFLERTAPPSAAAQSG